MTVHINPRTIDGRPSAMSVAWMLTSLIWNTNKQAEGLLREGEKKKSGSGIHFCIFTTREVFKLSKIKLQAFDEEKCCNTAKTRKEETRHTEKWTSRKNRRKKKSPTRHLRSTALETLHWRTASIGHVYISTLEKLPTGEEHISNQCSRKKRVIYWNSHICIQALLSTHIVHQMKRMHTVCVCVCDHTGRLMATDRRSSIHRLKAREREKSQQCKCPSSGSPAVKWDMCFIRAWGIWEMDYVITYSPNYLPAFEEFERCANVGNPVDPLQLAALLTGLKTQRTDSKVTINWIQDY